MPKRKKTEPIISLGKNPTDKLTVQKSLPLFSLWKSNLTLSEFKILDIYLSRIDSHNPEKRSVLLNKGEIEKALGLKEVKTDVLEERIKNLMTTVRIDDDTVKKGFKRIALFEQVVAEPDDNDLWEVELTCTSSAMKYIFNIENLGYLRYKLTTITSLTSRYTYILFVYLEANRFRKSWEIPIDELKEMLNCQAESYHAFKEFNRSILQRCHKELTEKTPCKFKYEPIKKGRSVVSIKFTLETIKDLPQIEGQTSFFDDVAAKNTYSNDFIELLASACNNEFQEDEVLVLNSLMNDLELDTSTEKFVGERKFLYLQKKYNELNVRENDPKNKPIHNRFTYLKAMIK